MTPRFPIGIEEEFQMVDRHTGQLRPRIHTILEKGRALFGEQIKPEMLHAAWTSEGITEHFFDYTVRGTRPAQTPETNREVNH